MQPRRLTDLEILTYDYIEHSEDEFIANVNDKDVLITKEQYKELRIVEIEDEIREVEAHLLNLKEQVKEIEEL